MVYYLALKRRVFMQYTFGELIKIHSKVDMSIYRKIDEYVNGAIVVPFDKDILNYLNSHVDKNNSNLETNYLDGLNSSYSIGKCYRFARYLALAMEGRDFKLCEGHLHAFDQGDFTHAWLEDDDFVYDVAFMGVWPKDVYYKLFVPSIDGVVDLNTDPAYQEYKKNTIEAHKQRIKPFLTYRDWYSYYYSTMVPFMPLGISNEVKSFYFPCDKEEAFLIDFMDNIDEYWHNTCKENRPLPEEVREMTLIEFICGENYLKDSLDLYREYINFISANYVLYERQKNISGDLVLWRESINQNCSGSFCRFIGDLPKVLSYIDAHKKEAC